MVYDILGIKNIFVKLLIIKIVLSNIQINNASEGVEQ